MLSLKKKYLKFIKKQETKKDRFRENLKQLDHFYLPLCDKLFETYKAKGSPLLLGLSGGQGSGKSTISQILKIILNYKFNLKVVCLSIDDFYKTSYERKKMAKLIHPLFSTRGVPGTHDCKMLLNTIKTLLKKRFNFIKIPKFDKSRDNRLNKKYWKKIKIKPNIIIFEGWCVGAKHQTYKELKKPINILEKKEDTKLTWRKKVNNELKTSYKKIYNLLDKKIYLKVPGFKYVLKWRLLQEKKLRNKSNGKSMTNEEIKRFIMFYERITKNMVKNYKNNDFIILLDKKHKIKSIKF